MESNRNAGRRGKSSIRVSDVAKRLSPLIETCNDPIFVADADGKVITCNSAAAKRTDHQIAELENSSLLALWETVNGKQKELDIILDLIPDLVCVASTRGYFLKLNAAWERTLGYSLEELMSSPFTDFIHPDDIVPTMQEVQRQIGGDSTIKFVNRYISKSGAYKTLEWLAVPSPDGELLYASAREITDQYDFQKKLEDSEMHYRHLADNGTVLIWTAGTDKKCDYFNKIWLDFTGRSLQQELGDGWAEGVHPEDWKQCIEAYTESFDKGLKFSMQYRLRYHDGSYRWIQDDGTPRYDKNGKFLGYIGYCFDIHEQKLQQEVLKKTEENYRSLYLDNPQPMISYNKEDLRIIEANPAALRLYGYTRDEFLSLTVKDIRPKEDLPLLYEKLQLTAKDPVGEVEGIRHIRKKGEIFWVSLTYHDLEYKGVKIRHAAISDITKRKISETSLKESEYRNRLLFESIGYGIVYQDANGSIVSANRAAERILGLSMDQIVGRKSIDPEWRSIHEDGSDFPGNEHPSMIALSTGKIVRNIIMGIFNPVLGDTTWINVSATPLFREDEPKPYQVYATFEDITEAKKAREELRILNESLEMKVAARTVELEAANKAKSEFLANMSHELRTPMNAVLGYAELLSKEEMDQTRSSYVNSIRKSGKSLLSLINDILDLSKIEAGKFDLEYDFVDMQFFFSELESLFSLKIQEKGVRYILEIAPDLPKRIYIDEARLRQIAVNLIGNAVKFTSEGQIVLRAFIENSRQKARTKKGKYLKLNLVVQVEDTGLGIAAEMQEIIFEPFEQARDFKNSGGTGLGLAISRKLAALMQGTLTLISEPGKGSVFTLRIPDVTCSNDATPVLDKKLEVPEVIFSNAVILIVDDVANNRGILADALRNTPIVTYEAENGNVGFEIARRIIPDLIISDIRMPVLDGFHMLEKLKSNKETSHIPVIAYSASVLKDQRENILSREFAGLLIKPVSISSLYTELMKFIPFKAKTPENQEVSEYRHAQTQDVIDRDELIRRLDKEFTPRWQKFSVIQPMNQLEDFGRELTILGEHHHAKSISGYGQEMKDAASNFDIEGVLGLLKKFPDLVGEIAKCGVRPM